MSARNVCSGIRPSFIVSLRAISAPPTRPETWTLIPSAPIRIVDAIAVFTARRNDTRPSNWRAMFCPTITASTSGRFTSKILIWTSLPVSFFNSSLSLSTSWPPLPMMIPGRAVAIVTVTSFSVRSMMIFEMLAFAKRTFRYLRILASSTNFSEKSLPPNQLESQPRMMPRRFAIGLTFCPI